MKKLFALALAVVMVLSFAACGKEKRPGNNTSGQSVDSNTLEIVNNAYTATKTALENAKAMGYSGTIVKSVTIDDVITSQRNSINFKYADGDSGRAFAVETVSKSGDTSEEVQLYNNGENLYGYKAGTTYVLSKNKDTDAYVEELFKEIGFIDASAVKVLNTTIVDTSTGGHGFVLDYDFNDAAFDPETMIGTAFFNEKADGKNVTVTGLCVSGIIDTKGRLTAQNVTFEYTYTVDAEVPNDVDPDNSGVSETTKTVTKTVSNKISFDFAFNYELETVTSPDHIVIGGEGAAEPTEISISDFNKLSAAAAGDNG